MTHVMLDLETLGTAPGCVVLSIGAVVFDPVAAELGAEFSTKISRSNCEVSGLKVDPRTEQWWAGQSDAARAAAFGSYTMLREALADFDAFWAKVGGTHLWGHGASFDAPVLEAAYRAVGWAAPWKYNATRCTRTLYELAHVEPDRTVGTHHNALDDAKAQALAAIAAMRKLGCFA